MADRGGGMTETSEARRPSGNLSILFSLGLGVWLTVLTGTWLAGSHPWGATGRAIFAGYFLWLAYQGWRSKHSHHQRRGSRGLLVLAILAAVGAVVLWVVAGTTGDPEYRHEAIGFSFWGGMLAVLGLTFGMLRTRQAKISDGEENPDPSSS